MKDIPRILVILLAVLAIIPSLPASASPLSDFADAWAKINDYSCHVKVHEIDGSKSEDRVYAYAFKKPHMARTDIIEGPGKGGGAVWLGGDKVKGHQGGFLSGIHLTVDIKDKRATSLRGDTIDTGTFGAILDAFKTTKGELSEGPGPAIEGTATEAITLKVASPAANNNVSRDQLFISKSTHLPVRRVRYEGDKIVKDETFSNLKLNPGLSEADFPY